MTETPVALAPHQRTTTSRRVIAVDPGTHRMGWAVLDCRGAKLSGRAAGVVRARPKDALEARLHHMHQALVELIQLHRPHEFAVEDVFFAKYPNAAIKLGHARGVILLAATQHDLTVSTYSPAVVKRTVAGRGAAAKDQVARLVCAMVGWPALDELDATDALSIAITHARALQTRRSSPQPRPKPGVPMSPR